MQQLPNLADAPADTRQEEWSARISPQVLASLKESEINRQTYVGTFSTFVVDGQLSFIESFTSL